MRIRCVIFLLVIAALAAVPAWGESIHVDAGGTVNFSPNGGCTDALVQRIKEARSEILVQCYSFTSRRIAGALEAAARHGVKVRVLADPSNLRERASLTRVMATRGVDVLYDDAHAIAHNKVMVFDGRAVAMGSFNFTGAAERSNAENLLILEDAGLAAVYAKNWHTHEAHSKPAEKVDMGCAATVSIGRSEIRERQGNSGKYRTRKARQCLI